MKPSNPMKICNFVGRVRGLKVFVGHFTYECDFIILEDTTSIIDHDLGAVVFGKPFVKKTGLIYDKKEGTVAFEDNNEKLIFKMPHKMEMFKNVDFTRVSTDMIPPFIIGGNDDDIEKTHCSDSLNLGPEYKYDERVCKAIQSLIRMKNIRKGKGEVIEPSCLEGELGFESVVEEKESKELEEEIKEEFEEEEDDDDLKYFNTFPAKEELDYHKYLVKNNGPPWISAKDINSVVDPCLSQVVLGKPFVEVSNMTYDPSIGIVKFTYGVDEVAYQMPRKVELRLWSNMEKEHKQSVYFRNDEDKRRGVDYVIKKILGFNKECL
ncbi:hypothetical protein Tco_0015511 [Tanacetum coccineum]